jgi:anti-sigma regulatory factor (Ser/Thr protein kinase)
LLVCVTELAANAIEHTLSGAGGAFTVEVARPADGVAYVAVTDAGGDDWPVPDACWPADLGADDDDVAGLAEGGRGLVMVAACSSRWGYAKASGPSSGCTIWAEATWRVPIGARC